MELSTFAFGARQTIASLVVLYVTLRKPPPPGVRRLTVAKHDYRRAA